MGEQGTKKDCVVEDEGREMRTKSCSRKCLFCQRRGLREKGVPQGFCGAHRPCQGRGCPRRGVGTGEGSEEPSGTPRQNHSVPHARQVGGRRSQEHWPAGHTCDLGLRAPPPPLRPLPFSGRGGAGGAGAESRAPRISTPPHRGVLSRGRGRPKLVGGLGGAVSWPQA